MKQKHLVVKRNDNKKLVSKDKGFNHTLLIADYQKSNGENLGILEALLSQPEKQIKIQQLKSTLRVSEVSARVKRTKDNDDMRKYFEKDSFIYSICKWIELNIPNAHNKTIVQLSNELANAQRIIIESEAIITDLKVINLEKILKMHAPKLLYSMRERQWWEGQIAKRKSI